MAQLDVPNDRSWLSAPTPKMSICVPCVKTNLCSESLDEDIPFSFRFETIIANRLEIPEHKIYHVLHSNGFIKLATMTGRLYWIAQAMHDNVNPDWKIHFSVHEESLSRAWDILANLFIELNCPFGMKTRYARFNAEFMVGREITVYIFRHHQDYENEPFSYADEQSAKFWNSFVEIAENRLTSAGIVSNGLANGDRPLGRYASLRNEAFVYYNTSWSIPSEGLTGLDLTSSKPLTSQLVYPPNDAGYNAAGHRDPLRLSCVPCQ